jgi:predicted transcriptional regulator
MKTAERDMARRLRREEGRSIKEIAAVLRVSQSSVSLWVRDIELTVEQHDALLERNPAHNRQRARTRSVVGDLPQPTARPTA